MGRPRRCRRRRVRSWARVRGRARVRVRVRYVPQEFVGVRLRGWFGSPLPLAAAPHVLLSTALATLAYMQHRRHVKAATALPSIVTNCAAHGHGAPLSAPPPYADRGRTASSFWTSSRCGSGRATTPTWTFGRWWRSATRSSWSRPRRRSPRRSSAPPATPWAGPTPSTLPLASRCAQRISHGAPNGSLKVRPHTRRAPARSRAGAQRCQRPSATIEEATAPGPGAGSPPMGTLGEGGGGGGG